MKLGQQLKNKSIINDEQLKHALEIQAKEGGKLGDILLAITSMKADDYYRSLAKHYDIPFLDLSKYEINYDIIKDSERELYAGRLILPVKLDNQEYTVVTSNPSDETFHIIKQQYGENTKVCCASRYDILYLLQSIFKIHYLNNAIESLLTTNQSLSSKYLLSTWQRFFFLVFLVSCTYFLAKFPMHFFWLANIYLMLSVSGILIYKVFLALTTIIRNRKIHLKKREKIYQKLADYPIYTILVPVFREKEITLQHLMRNIRKIDYPKHKLDIKILLEQDDIETIAILKKMDLPRNIEFVYVPYSTPQTKGKACNYGLQFAKGEFLTLYDAEDRPDKNQLKTVLKTFRKYDDENIACVQCKLNFYNASDNWLTRMFSLEYSYWFDMLLPALEFFKTPIPLGGTSNHFKVDALREVSAWDPFNVAEDADLGVRLNRLGYSSRVASSTTYEEATCHFGSWIKQRTRWIKGYMQTYLVHMHNPLKLIRSVGVYGFLGFQLFIGGTIITNLSNMLLWIIFILCLFAKEDTYLSFLYAGSIWYFALFNLLSGSILMIALNMIGQYHQLRKNKTLIFYALSSPIYWLMMSLASYRAVYQLIFKPSIWEKTQHGVSKTLN